MCTAAATRGRARDGEVVLRRSGAGRGRSDAQDARSRDHPPARSRHAVPGGARHLQVRLTPPNRTFQKSQQLAVYPAARHTILRAWWRAVKSPRFTDKETEAP